MVRTHAIPDPGALLALLPHTGPDGLVSWVRHGEGLVGWGRAATFEVSGPDRFAHADQWWRDVVAHAVVRDEVRQPGSGPVVFGSLPFADGSAEQGLMVVPEVVVGRRADRWWVTTIGHDSHLPPIPSLGPWAPGDAPADVRFTDGALTPDDWKRAVSKAVERISRGELDKVVLARDLRVHAAAPIDPRWLLGRWPSGTTAPGRSRSAAWSARLPSCWSAATRDSSSPGCWPAPSGARGDDARDLALAASLARSSKDLEEHEYAVRSVAEALAPHCTSVNVPETPFVLHLPNVMHLATDVAGVAADHARRSTSPRRCTRPRRSAGRRPTWRVALIGELEGMDRGRYAGPVGWMDAPATASGRSRCAAAGSTMPTRRVAAVRGLRDRRRFRPGGRGWPRPRPSSSRCAMP